MSIDPNALLNRKNSQQAALIGLYLVVLFLDGGLVSAEPHSAPQTASLEQKSFRLSDPDLVIELVAAEPDVQSPVAIAWDAEKRLYVVEMNGYPQTEGEGRIRRLEDTDNSTLGLDGIPRVSEGLPSDTIDHQIDFLTGVRCPDFDVRGAIIEEFICSERLHALETVC